jgi:small subunit ribosomal protein S9
MPPKAKKEKEVKIAAPAPVLPLPEVAVTAPAQVIDEEELQLDQIIAASDQAAGAKEKYYEAVGRRKESVARIRLYTKKSTDTVTEDRAILTVNGKDYKDYFQDANLLTRIESPLRKLKSLHRFKVTALVRGGGIAGQADAVRHGIARALEKFDANFRKKLKKAGFLTRDSREKERRKYGHKKARKSGRWSKR